MRQASCGIKRDRERISPEGSTSFDDWYRPKTYIPA
jgi:hypothetical protein